MRTCSVGRKVERSFGDNFFWVLGGIPEPGSSRAFEYYIMPAAVMAEQVSQAHRAWLAAGGRNGLAHNDSNVRTVHLPPYTNFSGWSIKDYCERCDLIEDKLRDTIT